MKATVDLFLPRTCACCNEPLLAAEDHLCLLCYLDLPYTRSEDDPDSHIEQLFWGKVQLQAVGAMLHFTKGGKVQRILHRLKYRGDLALADYLGKLMSERLKNSVRYNGVDMIIPVPLHSKKERSRGFNQSGLIAQAIAERMGLQYRKDLLTRSVRTSTQTKKDRMQRWENVKDVFHVSKPHELLDKHILLVDDVITTGATLEGCVLRIQEATNARISIYAAAIA